MLSFSNAPMNQKTKRVFPKRVDNLIQQYSQE